MSELKEIEQEIKERLRRNKKIVLRAYVRKIKSNKDTIVKLEKENERLCFSLKEIDKKNVLEFSDKETKEMIPLLWDMKISELEVVKA